VKIGPVNTEIALLIVKKNKEKKKKKLTQAKYIARSAGLPSGLNKNKKWRRLANQLTIGRSIFIGQSISSPYYVIVQPCNVQSCSFCAPEQGMSGKRLKNGTFWGIADSLYYAVSAVSLRTDVKLNF